MVTKRSAAVFAGLVIAASACFRQVVDTGLPAGTKTIAKPWTSTWIFGLVEAQPIDVRRDCPGGVAIVETQMTFLNGLVGGLTLGIWTPLSVTVTCSGASASALPRDARVLALTADDDATVALGVRSATKLAASSGEPVYVTWQASSVQPNTR